MHLRFLSLVSRVVGVGVVVAGAVSGAGCPIDGVRDGIGRPCDVDGPVCPLDHTCVPDDAADPGAGLCAPILDYGSCPDPSYPQKPTKTEAEAVVVDDAADLGKLEDVATLDAGLKIAASGFGELLAIGDLCAISGVQHVGGALVVTGTDLTTLDGLQGLSFVGGGILINANGDLVDVLGLQNLIVANPPDGRDFGVALSNNRSLDEPAIDALRDALRESAPGVKIFSCGNKNTPVAFADCPSFNDLLD